MADTVNAALRTNVFSSAGRYVDLPGWYAEVDSLRATGPIHRIDMSQDGFPPFWAVIGHAEIMEILRQPDVFRKAPRVNLERKSNFASRMSAGADILGLVSMDGAKHAKYRRLVSDWFRPARLRSLQDRVDELAEQALRKLEDCGGTCDFSQDVAVWFPLQTILAILGLPESDYSFILSLTQALFGSGEDVAVNTSAAINLLEYMTKVAKDRRERPTNDLATVIANGRIDGEPLSDLQASGLMLEIATAGHDTTSSSMTGGLHALIENPDQMTLLQHDPSLINNAVEETVRWVTAIRHFLRNVAVDSTIAGVPLSPEDLVYVSFLGANRDPRVFTSPYEFDIRRENADKHLGFGFGDHFCLGAQLARMQLRTLFGRLIPRLASVELVGEPISTKTYFLGGINSLPISFELTDAP